ncbi:MAG: holin family protein [Roseovarius sp.]
MGLIPRLFGFLFGDGRNVIAETAQVFRVGADAADARAAETQAAALAQFAAEFQAPRKGLFDRMIDGLNRVPRPAMALGTIALFVSAMTHPVWFAERMQGIALVPEPLWWLLGVVVSFYFGARHQAKGQEFQRSIAETLARTPQVVSNIETLRALEPERPQEAGAAPETRAQAEENAALRDWAARQAGAPMS